MLPESIHLSLFVTGLVLFLLPFLSRKVFAHRLVVEFLVFALTLYYMKWRLLETVIPVEMPTVGGFWIWFCFMIELMVLTETFTFFFMSLKKSDNSPKADKFEEALRSMQPDELPTIDVMIPTYNEGIDVLERSILGALHLDWPKHKLKVWVLDDGKRDWLREYCMEKGAGYICRPDNMHAKAGNLNHAFECTDGDLIAIFDADFVPYRNFIYRTAGFFIDPKVGILQTPQHFFNRDYIQSNLHLQDSLPDDQRMFFDYMMPRRDAFDSAFWCGSCSLTRRSAMRKIGGVPTESVTEDLLTTLALFRHGYITRYLNEKLSHGLAPETMEGLNMQRKRWCRGTIQALYSEDGPFGKGLTFGQRFLFFPTHWLFGPLTRVMTLFIPIFFLWTGYPALKVHHYEDVVFHQLPVLIANFAVIMWLSPSYYIPFINTAVNTINAIQVLPTAIHSLIWPHSNDFVVTPKGELNKKKNYHPLTMWSCVFLFLATIVGLAINMSPETQLIHDDGFWPVAAFWGILNTVTISIMLFISFEHPRQRKHDRFDVRSRHRVGINGSSAEVTVLDMSSSGARFELEDKSMLENVRKDTPIYLHLKEMGTAKAEIMNVIPKKSEQKNPDTGETEEVEKHQISVQFHDLDPNTRDNIVKHLYTGNYDNAAKLGQHKSIWRGVISRMFGYHDHLYRK